MSTGSVKKHLKKKRNEKFKKAALDFALEEFLIMRNRAIQKFINDRIKSDKKNI